MRLEIFPIALLLAVCAAVPVQAAVLPLAKAQDVRDPKSTVLQTDVDQTTYDEQGQPISIEHPAPSLPRHSLEENLRNRNRRGYTVSFEPSDPIAIEQSTLQHRRTREGLTAFAEIAYSSLSAGDTSLLSRIQPLASSFQPLWVALVPTSLVDPATGQVVTVLVDVLGPSVGQNGFLSSIGGNVVLANSLVASMPIASGALPVASLSALQSVGLVVELPNQVDDAAKPSDPPLSLFNDSDDAEFKHHVIVNTEIAAVPEMSTWAMMLLGFSVIAIMVCRKSRKEFASSYS